MFCLLVISYRDIVGTPFAFEWISLNIIFIKKLGEENTRVKILFEKGFCLMWGFNELEK